MVAADGAAEGADIAPAGGIGALGRGRFACVDGVSRGRAQIRHDDIDHRLKRSEAGESEFAHIAAPIRHGLLR